MTLVKVISLVDTRVQASQFIVERLSDQPSSQNVDLLGTDTRREQRLIVTTSSTNRNSSQPDSAWPPTSLTSNRRRYGALTDLLRSRGTRIHRAVVSVALPLLTGISVLLTPDGPLIHSKAAAPPRSSSEIRKRVVHPAWRSEERIRREALGITDAMRTVDRVIEVHQKDFEQWRYVVDGERNLTEEKEQVRIDEAIMDLYEIVYACVEYHKSRDGQQQQSLQARAHRAGAIGLGPTAPRTEPAGTAIGRAGCSGWAHSSEKAFRGARSSRSH